MKNNSPALTRVLALSGCQYDGLGREGCVPRNIVAVAALSGEGVSRRARAQRSIRELESILNHSPHLPITLSDVSRLLNLERTYCCKVFRDLTGKTFSEWLRGIRIARARALLRLRVHTITDVSHAVGYGDVTTFERNFRKEVGLSPRVFQRLGQECGLQGADSDYQIRSS